MMRKHSRAFGSKAKLWASASILAIAALSGCTWDKVQPEVCFESEVLPVFVTYCSTSGCHNSTDRVEGYDFTTYAGIMRGVTPKRPGSSKVIESMGMLSEEHMPPSGYPQPSSGQIATIEAWIKLGAANTTNCGAAGCDTSAAVSYATDLVPMFTTYCNGCHSGGSPSAGLDLSDYATVQQYSLSGRIPGSVSGDPTYIAMPPSGSLPSCLVYKLQKWTAAGAPNN